MKLSSNEIDGLAKACARYVAPFLAERIAREYKIAEYCQDQDYESFIRRVSAGQPDYLLAIWQAVLQASNKKEIAADVAEQLFHEADNSAFQDVAGPLSRTARTAGAGLQALLQRRDHFIADENLVTLTRKLRLRVGIIVGEFVDAAGAVRPTSATAFLVGPDLILTARHTFDPILGLHGNGQIPHSFKVVFDHFAGRNITHPSDVNLLPDTRVVGLHPQDWLVAESPSVEWVGQVATPNGTEIAELKANLDFVLIRLSEPIGILPVRGGSENRGWIEIGELDEQDYTINSRVILPQHPFGSPLCYDFGRISRRCTCDTRMVYNLESADGASGAPCFNRNMQLIGVHSATYAPAQLPIGNLAVRFDKIRPHVAPYLSYAPPPSLKRIWRLGNTGAELVPIIGRERLLTWLDGAAGKANAPSARGRSDRIYTADAPDRGSGKTFTTQIVRSYLSAEVDHITIALGAESERLPDRIEDFVAILAQGFGMTAADLGQMPERPGVSLPKNAKDGDKLDRWASQELPEWFTERLTKHLVLTVNRTEAAKNIVNNSRLDGRPIDPKDQELAAAHPPVIVTRDRWRRAWIVLDDLDKRPPSSEVWRFIAGLIGVDVDESAVGKVRSSINWLFLGRGPDFLLSDAMTVEKLSADNVQRLDIETTIVRALDEIGADKTTAAQSAAMIEGFVPMLLAEMEQRGQARQTRLKVSQFVTGRHIGTAFSNHGRTP